MKTHKKTIIGRNRLFPWLITHEENHTRVRDEKGNLLTTNKQETIIFTK